MVKVAARRSSAGTKARGKKRQSEAKSAGDALKTSTDTAAAESDKFTYEEFVKRARNLKTPESELRPYFTIDRAVSRPFRPAVHLDATLVRHADGSEVRAEGVLDWANGFSRWRRQARFNERTRDGDDAPILVSEGDSWFQFPVFLDDVIDQLSKGYRIWSIDAGGDTLDNMVIRAPEYLAALKQHSGAVKAFLFSGGGNDLVGEDSSGRPVLEKVVRRHQSGQDARWHIATDDYAKTLNRIEDCLREVLTRVADQFPGLPVLLHGYDYAIPGPAPNEWRRPVWASIDEWLGRALRARGVVEAGLQGQIIKLMIDDLNERLNQLCGNGKANGQSFRNAWHVDIRGTLAQKDWADELHPTDAGFRKVAQKFRAALKKIVK